MCVEDGSCIWRREVNAIYVARIPFSCETPMWLLNYMNSAADKENIVLGCGAPQSSSHLTIVRSVRP